MAHGNHIAILMCTYNGAQFIEQQLDSIASQNHENWSLHIADDNSDDQTLGYIERFIAQNPTKPVRIYSGPQTGFCDNFMTLIQNKDIEADYFAISDQDDIWLAQKLSHALEKLKETGAALYGGRTILIDEAGKRIGSSPLFARPPSLRNSLVQSYAGGNTMLVTKAGIEHIRRAPKVEVISHDWWLYLLLTASGFQAYYDAEPMTLYRQHRDNKVGSNIGIRAKYGRMKRLLRSEFKGWNELHVSALNACKSILSDEGLKLSQDFDELRELRGFAALKKLSDMQLYRQTRAGEVALRVAAFTGKI